LFRAFIEAAVAHAREHETHEREHQKGRKGEGEG
jgi:hypothetical protein